MKLINKYTTHDTLETPVTVTLPFSMYDNAILLDSIYQLGYRSNLDLFLFSKYFKNVPIKNQIEPNLEHQNPEILDFKTKARMLWLGLQWPRVVHSSWDQLHFPNLPLINWRAPEYNSKKNFTPKRN